MEWSTTVLVAILLVVGFLVFGALLVYRRNVETHLEMGWMFYSGLAMVGAGIALSATVGYAGAALIVVGGVLMFTAAIRSHRSVRR
jgi:hypothetical protein